jgi:hypothetical protein
MRITRDTLIKAAKNAVLNRTMYNRRLICIYLTGSLLEEEPLLGGTTDIDLFFIHDSDQPVVREVERITDEVHLDIAHLSQAIFHQPRNLRIDPWIGPFLCLNPIVLHDMQHWFEFTQASVCSLFNQPEYILQRARPMAEEARNLWMDMHSGSYSYGPEQLQAYLRALEKAGNTIATLTGAPLTDRRFFLHLPERAREIGRPGMASGLTDLITAGSISGELWHTWIESWTAALRAAAEKENCPPDLHPCRLTYYTHAAEALRSDHADSAIWILLRTWTRALACQGEKQLPPALHEICQVLHLDEKNFEARLAGLDTYLDTLEESLEVWAHDNGG